MSYEIHIGRFSEDLEEEVSIVTKEWIESTEIIEDIQYNQLGHQELIEAFSEQLNKWIPIFWLTKRGGSMRASAFFNNPICYEKAIEIAQHFQAFIYGDEGEIYFLPEYGIVYDDVEKINPSITLDELIKYRDVCGNDYQKIIDVLESRTLTHSASTEVKRPKNKTKLNTQTFWIFFIPFLFILYLFFRLIKLFL
ncbi:hypothetical protein R9C00_14710 [Flammeovirgaceae bacterium SG7u.111]|nr:hypothetical protein [Flammeovirgaceae bacterium SG7u.132]WPO38710.1 hypothetical protein R9C00_14710 [Flammeovirgaceae bacterium SG7u.111]